MSPDRKIIADVARAHGVRVSWLLRPNRHKRVVRARWEAMYRLRHELRLSLPDIGHALGGMDHATVMHGLRQHAATVIVSAGTLAASGAGL